MFLHQRLYRHGHTEIGLSRARGADAKDDIFLLNGLDILPLHRRFRRHLFLAGRAETRAREIIAQTVSTVFGNLRKCFTQFPVSELSSFGKEVGEVLENLLGRGDVLRFASNGQVMAAGVDLNVEQRLEKLDVLVVNAKKRFQSSWWQLYLLQVVKLSP